MRYLVIGDIHTHTAWADSVIKRNKGKYDKVIFTGDYFDEFGDSPEIMEKTCKWLKRNISKRDYVFLLGNHDAGYICFGQPNTPVHTGFTIEKYEIFKKYFPDPNVLLKKMRVVYYVGVGLWVVSHAGFTEEWANVYDPNWDDITLSSKGVQNFGFARGGDKKTIPGPLWADYNDELTLTKNSPMMGSNQIVGHTRCKNIQYNTFTYLNNTRRTINIDTGGKEVLIVNDNDHSFTVVPCTDEQMKLYTPYNADFDYVKLLTL